MISIYFGKKCLLTGELREDAEGREVIHDFANNIDFSQDGSLASLMSVEDLQRLSDGRRCWLEIHNGAVKNLVMSYVVDDHDEFAMIENELGEWIDIHEMTLKELLADVAEASPAMCEPDL
jgi:hypothetical protein